MGDKSKEATQRGQGREGGGEQGGVMRLKQRDGGTKGWKGVIEDRKRRGEIEEVGVRDEGGDGLWWKKREARMEGVKVKERVHPLGSISVGFHPRSAADGRCN